MIALSVKEQELLVKNKTNTMPPQPNIEEVAQRLMDNPQFQSSEPITVLSLLISTLNEAYTSGFNTAKERAVKCVPSEEIAQFGRENSWEMEHANGFNSCRSQVLEAINNI